MAAAIFISMFTDGFPAQFAAYLGSLIKERRRFVFVASEFELSHDKTDEFFHFFLNMFTNCGIVFDEACVVDGRMSPQQAGEAAANADVLWLSGGDTQKQYGYFEKYGLIPVLKEYGGIIIGLSAGAINMAKTAVSTDDGEQTAVKVYDGLGIADISVDPHFESQKVFGQLLEFSNQHPVYGLCDNSAIVCTGENITYFGDIFLLDKGDMRQISVE